MPFSNELLGWPWFSATRTGNHHENNYLKNRNDMFPVTRDWFHREPLATAHPNAERRALAMLQNRLRVLSRSPPSAPIPLLALFQFLGFSLLRGVVFISQLARVNCGAVQLMPRPNGGPCCVLDGQACGSSLAERWKQKVSHSEFGKLKASLPNCRACCIQQQLAFVAAFGVGVFP